MSGTTREQRGRLAAAMDYPNPAVAKINGTALGTLTGAVTNKALVWNGTAWAPGYSAGIQVASVTLSSAQLLSIFTTAATIVAAPGAGLALVPLDCFFNYTYGGTPYTDHGGSLALRVGGASMATFTSAGFWDQSSSQAVYPVTSRPGVTSVNFYANQTLNVVNGIANPTLGNGTMTVTVA